MECEVLHLIDDDDGVPQRNTTHEGCGQEFHLLLGDQLVPGHRIPEELGTDGDVRVQVGRFLLGTISRQETNVSSRNNRSNDDDLVGL